MFVCVAAVLAAENAASTTAQAQVPADKHLLGVEGTTAYYCTCGADCKCKLTSTNATTCSCGKPITQVDVKGKFICDKCHIIMDKEGKCPGCGMELKEIK